MRQRLGGAIIHHADANARGKQHGQPAVNGEVGPGVVASEADPAERRDGHCHAEEQGDIRHADKEPVKGADHPVARPVQPDRGMLRRGEDGDAEGQDDAGGEEEDRVVNVQAEPFDIVLSDFVVGVVFDLRVGIRQGRLQGTVLNDSRGLWPGNLRLSNHMGRRPHVLSICNIHITPCFIMYKWRHFVFCLISSRIICDKIFQ